MPINSEYFESCSVDRKEETTMPARVQSLVREDFQVRISGRALLTRLAVFIVLTAAAGALMALPYLPTA
jgi:hypothetical protein